MSEYTPSDEQMRDWIVTVDVLGGHGGESKARYVRWLAAHDAEVARKTLEDAADELDTTANTVFATANRLHDERAWEDSARYFAHATAYRASAVKVRARAASIPTDKAEAGFHAPDCADCGTPKTQENADRKLWELHEWPCPLFYIGHWVDGKPERNCACDNPSTDKKEG